MNARRSDSPTDLRGHHGGTDDNHNEAKNLTSWSSAKNASPRLNYLCSLPLLRLEGLPKAGCDDDEHDGDSEADFQRDQAIERVLPRGHMVCK